MFFHWDFLQEKKLLVLRYSLHYLLVKLLHSVTQFQLVLNMDYPNLHNTQNLPLKQANLLLQHKQALYFVIPNHSKQNLFN